jgi:hypothetical protein
MRNCSTCWRPAAPNSAHCHTCTKGEGLGKASPIKPWDGSHPPPKEQKTMSKVSEFFKRAGVDEQKYRARCGYDTPRLLLQLIDDVCAETPAEEPRASDGRAIVVGSVWSRNTDETRFMVESVVDGLVYTINLNNGFRGPKGEAYFLANFTHVSDPPTASTTPDAIRSDLCRNCGEDLSMHVDGLHCGELDARRNPDAGAQYPAAAARDQLYRECDAMHCRVDATQCRGENYCCCQCAKCRQAYEHGRAPAVSADVPEPPSVDTGVIRAAEGVVLEAGEYDDIEAGCVLTVPKPLTAVWGILGTRQVWFWDVPGRSRPLTAVRRVEQQPPQPKHVWWCKRGEHEGECNQPPQPQEPRHGDMYPCKCEMPDPAANTPLHCVGCGGHLPESRGGRPTVPSRIIRSGGLEVGKPYRVVAGDSRLVDLVLTCQDEHEDRLPPDPGRIDNVQNTGRHVPAWFAVSEEHWGGWVTAVELVEDEAEPAQEQNDTDVDRVLVGLRAGADEGDRRRAESAAHRMWARNTNLRANAREQIERTTKERDEAIENATELEANCETRWVEFQGQCALTVELRASLKAVEAERDGLKAKLEFWRADIERTCNIKGCDMPRDHDGYCFWRDPHAKTGAKNA